MFGWQLHIKAKCEVKLAYTAVFIMLPLPAQTFFPLQSLSLARVRQPPNSNFYSLSLLHSSFMSFTRSSTERDQDVRQLNYSLQWSLYLSSLSIESCKRRRSVCTQYSCLWKIFQSSPWLSKSNKRRKSIYHRPFIDWRLGKWSYFSSFERRARDKLKGPYYTLLGMALSSYLIPIKSPTTSDKKYWCYGKSSAFRSHHDVEMTLLSQHLLTPFFL